MGDMADLVMEDPFGVREPVYVACRRCGKRKLVWGKNSSGKWWLIEADGSWHKCKTMDKEQPK
jgi:hypothetical protein